MKEFNIIVDTVVSVLQLNRIRHFRGMLLTNVMLAFVLSYHITWNTNAANVDRANPNPTLFPYIKHYDAPWCMVPTQ